MTQIYAKDSFDRFNEYLLEVILSYLPIKQKFKYQCLSKQWQRLVFNKEKLILLYEMDYYFANNLCKDLILNQRLVLNRFETILKKCQNITTIKMYFDVHNECTDNMNDVFELIIKYCNRLKQMNYGFKGVSEKTLKEFFAKFGPKLKTF